MPTDPVRVIRGLLRQFDRVPSPDHACGECVPGGEIVLADFRCALHEAIALVGDAWDVSEPPAATNIQEAERRTASMLKALGGRPRRWNGEYAPWPDAHDPPSCCGLWNCDCRKPPGRRIRLTHPPVRHVVDTAPAMLRVDPEMVAHALGAEIVCPSCSLRPATTDGRCAACAAGGAA